MSKDPKLAIDLETNSKFENLASFFSHTYLAKKIYECLITDYQCVNLEFYECDSILMWINELKEECDFLFFK